MDCFLTYNLSCVNNTFTQLNSSSSSLVLGEPLDSSFLNGGDRSNVDLTSSNQPSSILVSVQHCVITALILGAIILSTITGNILVIAAVKLEKSLHSVAYYLFVSLAVADLMVASMVSSRSISLFVYFLFWNDRPRRGDEREKVISVENEDRFHFCRSVNGWCDIYFSACPRRSIYPSISLLYLTQLCFLPSEYVCVPSERLRQRRVNVPDRERTSRSATRLDREKRWLHAAPSCRYTCVLHIACVVDTGMDS